MPPLQACSGRHRAGLGAADDLVDHLAGVDRVGRANSEPGGRVGWDDVRRAATVGDDAVDADIRPQLLAQQPDGVEHLDDGVERVDALVWRGSGVGRLAEELERQPVGDECRVERHVVLGAGVDHDRGVDIVEVALLDQRDLTAGVRHSRLLGRAAEDDDAAGKLVGQRAERDPSADRGSGDDVMSAAMANLGQRVVLGEDRHRRLVHRSIEAGPKAGFHPGGLPLDRCAVLLEGRGQSGDGFPLLVTKLGMLVHPVADPDQFAGNRLNPLGRRFLQLGDALFGHIPTAHWSLPP